LATPFPHALFCISLNCMNYEQLLHVSDCSQ